MLLPVVVPAAAACLAFAYIGYVLWPRWPVSPVPLDAPALPITVSGVTFNIPPAAIRVPVQRRPGAQERVDLVFAWPSLVPPAAYPERSPPRPDLPPAAATLDRIFVTIAGAGDNLDPAERLLTIYPRYTEAEAQAGPAGLTLLAFRDGTPYQGEDLIYDATAPGFLVRCSRAGPGATPGTCLYERRIGGAELVLRLARDWLDDWRVAAANVERLIAQLRPVPSR